METEPSASKTGRPRREQGPKLPREEVDRLLVEGELVTEPEGNEIRHWPSQRQLALRYGVAASLIGAFAKKNRCGERRKAFLAGKLDEAAPPSTKTAAAATAEPAESKRKPGRPRKADAPLIPYEELDRLLVFGEAVVLESGATTTVYPTYRQLAERYGVVPSVIANYAKSHNCGRRRAEGAKRIAIKTENKLIDLRAEAIAVGEDRLVQMIDNFLLNFEKALDEGRVRSDNPTDVNTLARLKAFILGGADSRQDVRAVLSLETLQERYARMLRDERETTPAMTGVIDTGGVPVHEAGPAGPPRRQFDNADPKPNVPGDLAAEVSDLVNLARDLALAMDAEPGDEALLENRVLRAVGRVEARLSAPASADVGPRGAAEPEDAP